MVRYTTDDDVAYGLDHATGVFLSVPYYSLMKLGGKKEASELKAAYPGIDNDDLQFDLRTGKYGLGKQATPTEIAAQMKRFGVPKVHIAELLGHEIADGC